MKIVLVEADYLDEQGQVKTTYLANAPFYSSPIDTPPNQPYDDYIVGGLSIENRMTEVLNGRTERSTSSVELLNMPEIIQGNYSGQQARVFIGEKGQDKAQFTQIYTASIEDLTVFNEEALQLSFVSHNDKMMEPLQKIDIPGSSYLKPIAYGKCFNVRPAVFDADNRVYTISENALESIQAVRKNGVSISRTDDLANGKITLSSQPGGTVTADITAPLKTPKAIILDILARASVTNIDSASLDLLPAVEISLYISNGESANSALDSIVNSLGFFWSFKRNGQFYVGAFDETKPSSAEIYPDEIMQNGMRVSQTIKPAKDIKLTYNPNWGKQSDNLDASLTIAQRTIYSSTGSVVTSDNSAILAQYPNAKTREPIVLIINQADAQAEADRRANLLNKTKRIYQVKAFVAPFNFELGQVITIYYPFMEFASGKTVIITGIIDDPLSATSTIEVFG